MSLTIAQIIEKARSVAGNELQNSAGESFVPDEAITIELAPIIRKINSKFGSATGLKEVFLTVVADQQDYAFSAVASDVKTITEVMRSGADVPAGSILGGGYVDPAPFNDASNMRGVIPAGLQPEVFDDIIAQHRWRAADEFSWETFGTTLRLFPPPVSGEVIAIRYVTTGSSVDTIPDTCETLLVYAAVAALFDGELNRINRTRVTTKQFTDADAIRSKMCRDQRDYYQKKYQGELSEVK